MPTFERTLIYSDGALTANATCSAGIWCLFWQWTNPEPNSITYVGGKHGYIYISTVDEADGVNVGRYRLVVGDPNTMVRKVVWEGRSEMVAADKIDKTEKIKLDLRKPGVKYQSVLQLEFLADGAAEVLDYDDTTNNEIFIDVTQVVA